MRILEPMDEVRSNPASHRPRQRACAALATPRRRRESRAPDGENEAEVRAVWSLNLEPVQRPQHVVSAGMVGSSVVQLPPSRCEAFLAAP